MDQVDALPIYEWSFYVSVWVAVVLWAMVLLLLAIKIRTVYTSEALSVGGVLFTSSLMVLFFQLFWAFSQSSRLGFFEEGLWLTLSQPRYLLLVNIAVCLSAIVVLASIKQRDLETIARETEQARELRVLYRVAQVVASDRDPSRLLARVMDQAFPMRHMESGWVARWSGGKKSTILACSGVAEEAVPPLLAWLDQLALQKDLGGTIVAGGLAVAAGLEATHCVPPPGFYTCLGVPLEASRDMMGYLFCASSAPQPLTQAAVRLARGIATLLALAVENQYHEAQIGQLAVQIERHRLADRVHDGLSHAMASLKLFAGMARRSLEAGRAEETAALLKDLETGADQGYEEARSAIDFLRKDQAQAADVEYLSQTAVRDWEGQGAVTVEMDFESIRLALSAAVAAELARIALEAVRNVKQHAAASRVTVACRQRDGQLEVSITDDGVGFDPQAAATGHWGLTIMRERALAVGATVAVDSLPMKGCRVTISLPVQPGAELLGDSS